MLLEWWSGGLVDWGSLALFFKDSFSKGGAGGHIEVWRERSSVICVFYDFCFCLSLCLSLYLESAGEWVGT